MERFVLHHRQSAYLFGRFFRFTLRHRSLYLFVRKISIKENQLLAYAMRIASNRAQGRQHPAIVNTDNVIQNEKHWWHISTLRKTFAAASISPRWTANVANTMHPIAIAIQIMQLRLRLAFQIQTCANTCRNHWPRCIWMPMRCGRDASSSLPHQQGWDCNFP